MGPPNPQNVYTVVVIGLNSEGKLAVKGVAGKTYLNSQDAQAKLDELRERYRNPVYWPEGYSYSAHLEVWSLQQIEDALNSGRYARFF